MRITIENLKHFHAVVRFKSLNLAAEKISISPSAVSRSIKIIEQDLGYLLFLRQGRRIILNQSGQRFYERSFSLIESYEDLYDNSLSGEFSGTYKVGASHWLASRYLPQKLEQIMGEKNDVKFEIFSQDSNVSILKVLSGELDFALCFSPKKHPELESVELGDGQLKLCSSKGHPLVAMPAKKCLKEISQWPGIVHKANEFVFSCDDHPMFLKFGIDPKFRYFWDSDFTAMELMKQNNYWTMMPEIIIENEPSIEALEHPIDWSAPYTIEMVWHKEKSKKLTEKFLTAFTENSI